MTTVSSLRRQLARFRRNERGGAAVEFGLLAPVLVAICLSTIDLGFALSERMAMDHSLRAAASRAMSDPGQTTVQTVLEETAKKTFPSASSNPTAHGYPASGNPLTVTATRYCACPSNKNTSVSCTSNCSGATPLAFYTLAATKNYSGILLPQFAMSADLKVQVK